MSLLLSSTTAKNRHRSDDAFTDMTFLINISKIWADSNNFYDKTLVVVLQILLFQFGRDTMHNQLKAKSI